MRRLEEFSFSFSVFYLNNTLYFLSASYPQYHDNFFCMWIVFFLSLFLLLLMIVMMMAPTLLYLVFSAFLLNKMLIFFIIIVYLIQWFKFNQELFINNFQKSIFVLWLNSNHLYAFLVLCYVMFIEVKPINSMETNDGDEHYKRTVNTHKGQYLIIFLLIQFTLFLLCTLYIFSRWRTPSFQFTFKRYQNKYGNKSRIIRGVFFVQFFRCVWEKKNVVLISIPY